MTRCLSGCWIIPAILYNLESISASYSASYYIFKLLYLYLSQHPIKAFLLWQTANWPFIVLLLHLFDWYITFSRQPSTRFICVVRVLRFFLLNYYREGTISASIFMHRRKQFYCIGENTGERFSCVLAAASLFARVKIKLFIHIIKLFPWSIHASAMKRIWRVFSHFISYFLILQSIILSIERRTNEKFRSSYSSSIHLTRNLFLLFYI